MQNVTTEFSFMLHPAEHDIGVFAAHGIKSGTLLRLFGNETAELEGGRAVYKSTFRNSMRKEDVPEFFRQYCRDKGDNTLFCPQNFGCMEIGWYLNHSETPNVYEEPGFDYFALRDIKKGEEITIDYNTIGVL